MNKYKVVVISVITMLSLVLFLHVMNRAPNQELPRIRNGIELTMEQEVYPTSAEKIGIKIHNQTETEYQGGNGGKFPIDKFFAGSWYRVPFKDNTITAEERIIPPGETAIMYTAVNDLDGELTPGKYRARHGGMAVPFEVKE